MEAGVKLLCNLLIIFNVLIFEFANANSREIHTSQNESPFHSIAKRQASTRVEWDDTEPFLDGPNTDDITISGNTIFMNEEMPPDVIIARLNYFGTGVVSFRFFFPSQLDTQLGLTWERQNDGSIYLISTLKQDYEAGHLFYLIEITITEATLTKAVMLTLEIINIDDNPPVVNAPGCSVDELTLGITECIFNIYDADGYISLSVMELRFVGADIVNQSFNLINRVDNSEFDFSISLNVIQELDFFYHQLHIFTLVAYDSLPNNGSAQVIVRVNDLPNMPPMWQTIFATETFDEKTSQSFTVRAIDGDTGINKDICYDLEKEFIDPVITIGTTDGVINVEPIDRDELEQEIFRFDIIAYKCDNRSWTTPSTAVFVVNDINDQIPDPITSDFEISILEESYVSLDFPEVITFHDKDLAMNARYSVALESISPPTAAESFLIIPRDGYQRQEFQISIIDASKLDFDTEEWQTINLRVVATEEVNITHIGTAIVTIHLQNWNDELPIFNENAYTATIDETAPAGEYIATVIASDRDIGDTVTHSIRGTTQEYLSIDPETGEITVRIDDAFDYDRQQEIVVQVEARDSLNSTTSEVNTVLTQLTINIRDINNKPPQITMLPVSPTRETHLRTICASTQILRPRLHPMDQTTTPKEDRHRNLNFIINLNQPRDPTNVVEHVLDGSTISESIIGSDVDTDANIIFNIDWDSSYATKQGRFVDLSLYQGCVDIETVYTDESSTRNAIGRLIAKQISERANDTLDFEVIEVLYLSIVLTDIATVVGTNYTQGILAINIEDINDNPPIWNEGTDTKQYFVREEAATDIVIDSVQATDIDGPQYNVISYRIMPRNGTGNDLVKINDDSGQMTVMMDQAISADLPPTYYLYYTLIASDCSVETGPDCYDVEIDLAIYITDTNTQTPFHDEDENTQNIVYIREHSDEGSFVMDINGKDWDRDEIYHTVSYTIDYRTLPDLERVFGVDIETGTIVTKLPVDLERDYGMTRHTVPVQMVDNYYLDGDRTQRSNSISIEVILLDINDNAPEFQPSNEVWTISESTDQNTHFATIRAYDRDEEDTPRSQIVYEILSVSKISSDGLSETIVDDDLFDIQTVTVNDGTIYKYAGNLMTKTSLRSHWGAYNIVIEAHDVPEDEEIQRNSMTHLLTVEPHNFNIPAIMYPGNGQTIRLSLEEAEFGRLRYASNGSMLNLATAIDEDGGEAGRVTFEIVGDAPALGLFSMDNYANNEAQFLLEDRITEASQYTVVLVASDHGSPQLTSNITFSFEVMSTESMPQFLIPQYTTNFTELDVGPTESQVLPAAVDQLEGRDLYYYIADFDTTFNVNKVTREVTLHAGVQLNRAERDSYEIRYRVSIVDPDVETNPRYSEMTVIIEVREKNPVPVFELSQYVGSISIIDDVSKKITTVIAHHSENLDITYAIELSSMVADPSLESVKDVAFSIGSTSGDINLEIKPLATMHGQFQFNVSATDSDEKSSMAIVIVFVVSEDNRVTFSFLNTLEQVEERRAIIATIFSEEFQYQCSIDSIVRSTDSSGLQVDNRTDVRTYFLENDIAISADILAEKRGDYEFVTTIIRRFNEVDLILGDFLSGTTIAESLEQMLQIILIVVSTVLGTLCLLLVVAFCLRIRSLNRRLEALSVTKFGSQDSGLNRVGITVPGTNKHALEGSNPVWNEDIKAPNFDELSNYSGDSDLIGIEDNPQFAYENNGFDNNENEKSDQKPTRRNTKYINGV